MSDMSEAPMAIAQTECPSRSSSPTTLPLKAPTMQAVMNGRLKGSITP